MSSAFFFTKINSDREAESMMAVLQSKCDKQSWMLTEVAEFREFWRKFVESVQKDTGKEYDANIAQLVKDNGEDAVLMLIQDSACSFYAHNYGTKQLAWVLGISILILAILYKIS